MPTKKPAAKKTAAKPDDWRAAVLARIRLIAHDADPEIIETVKWKKPTNPAGVAAFERDGLLFTGEIYKDKVKLTFADGAALKDPSGLFNASLDGNQRRAVDIREGEAINEKALKALIRAAVAHRAGRARRT